MLQSARLKINYPDPLRTDSADVPRDFGSIIAWLDGNAMGYGQGTLLARPTSTPGSPGQQGRVYVATDQTPHQLFYDYGTGWDPIGIIAHASTHEPGGSDELTHSAISALPLYETGVLNQLRAGRVLGLTDFTTLLGLSAPTALFNLSNVNDSSGNGRNLTNKGAVTFTTGVSGNAAEAALFTGSTGQALYIADAGVGDPFRITYGSWGCWFKTAKTGTNQRLIAKEAAGSIGYILGVSAANVIEADVSLDGAAVKTALGATNVCDDRWHHAVATYDGTTLSVYVDGVLEATAVGSGPIFSAVAPLNVGARYADGATAAALPHFGKVDEAFITTDVISADQVRMLYAVKIAHGFPVTPNLAKLNVRRRRKGGPLTVAPFSVQPLHLYDFTGGSLVDAGSLGVAVTQSGTVSSTPGADGAVGGGLHFSGAQFLQATDAGLPAGTTARTLGAWAKSITAGNLTVISYGSAGAEVTIQLQGGKVAVYDGVNTLLPATPLCNDGLWHQIVAVIDNAAVDGLKVKLYADGKLIGGATVLNGTVLGGANAFRMGVRPGGADFFTGDIDGGFVTGYAATSDEIAKWYAQGSQDMPLSPKNPGDHIEGVDATNIYAIFDTLESQHKIDLLVSA